MSNRTARRALERKAQKLKRRELQLAVAAPTPLTPNNEVAKEIRQAVNQANAQHSTGPLTPLGKATSARNSLKHGLTGNTVLLDSDDADEYQTRLDYYTSVYQPVTFEERRLVQAIHDANWRLDRITQLESTIYAKGRIDLETAFDKFPPAQRKSFIQLETSRLYAKDLRNLHIQESRLQRQRIKDLAALKELQLERVQAQAAEAGPEKEAELLKKDLLPETLSGANGFVFATAESTAEATLTPSDRPVIPGAKAA